MNLLEVLRTEEFQEWFDCQTFDERAIISSRINRLEEFAYLGDFKNLGQGLYELRWRNGRRIYFARYKSTIVLLLIGGLKNGQKKDIKKARNILLRFERS